MGSRVASKDAYKNAFRHIVNEGIRTLRTADTQAEISPPWYSSRIRLDVYPENFQVGRVFDLLDRDNNKIGRYRLVSLSVAPEGYYAVVGYQDDFSPMNGNSVPKININMEIES